MKVLNRLLLIIFRRYILLNNVLIKFGVFEGHFINAQLIDNINSRISENLHNDTSVLIYLKLIDTITKINIAIVQTSSVLTLFFF